MSSEDETDFVPTPVDDLYPPNNYSISAPEDPVYFATQQVEPITPAPEDPSVTPSTVITSDIIPIPVSEAEGLTDAFSATDPSGAELPPSTTVTGLFPNNVVFEGGVVCTLTGTALDLLSEIRIVGKIVPFLLVDPGTIQFTAPVAPDNSGGTKDVEAFDAFGVFQGSVQITYDPQVAVFGVSSIVPNSGSILGGEEIVVNGSAFYFIASVTVGNEPVYNFEILSTTAIKIVTPPGTFTGNPVDISVTSFDGSVRTLMGSFTYTYPGPFLLGVDKNSGDIAGSTPITLAGAFLDGTTSVLLGGAPVLNFTVLNAGRIEFQTAPSVFTGIPLDVTVTTPNGSDILFGAFTYSTVAPVPKITSVSPPTGVIGTFAPVTIRGSAFTGTVQVEFDGVAANSFSVVSDTVISCTAPFGSYNGGSAVNVKVTTMDGSFTRVGAFTFVYDVPTVTNTTLTTDLVAGGTPGSLTGTNFYEVTAVTIAGVPVQSYTVVSPTQIDYITGTAPNDNALPGNIQVITVFGIATLPSVFTYTYPPVSVSSINISTGFASGGMTVVLTGLGFTLVTQVLLAGVAVSSFTVDSLTQITCVTGPNPNPTNVPGDIVVQTVFTQATLPNAFTYVATMQLTSSSASNGVTTGGEVVTLTGVDFANIQSVFFAGTAAASFTIVNPTTIQAVTGASNTYGVLGDITIVTTFGENIVLANAFVYYPALSVTSIDINRGLTTGNQVRTLTGTGFADVTSVTVCGVNVTSFTVNTPTSMSITTAPNATLGTGDIIVTTLYTSYNFTNSFTYFPAMTVSSVSVSNGPSTGGTSVVVTGSGFFQINSVQFNATEVTSFTVNSLTQITITTASKTISDGELGDIVVTSPYTSATLSNAWTYWPIMNVVSLDVSSGPTTGGTTVVITGSGFYAVTNVRFNNISAASFTVDSPTQITAVTGIGALNGTANVVVDSIYTSATKSNAWTYYQPMSVSTLSVTNGPRAGGTTVVITGAGFFSVNSVTFNGVAVASYTVDSLTQITVVTGAKPSSNGDVGNVVVSSAYTSATKTNAWTYYPPMSVSSLDVSNGPRAGGTTVVITGAGFYSLTGITFNGTAVASYTVDSVTQITVVTGAKPSSTGDVGNVVVNSSFTSATGTNLWTYYPPVTVSSLDVTNGPRAGGTTVVITGSGFYSVSGVTFNGVTVASYTVDSLTQITVVTGAKPSSNGDVGNVVVTTSFTSGTGTNLWTYYPPMSVSSLDVSNGPRTGGTTVVITGAGFYSITGITFNGDAVTSYTVDSVTQITVVTGAGSANGTGNVVVTSTFTSATGTNLWTYWPVMSVTSLDVTQGSFVGGTTVNLTGTGFWNVSGVTIKGVSVRSFTVNSETSATIVTDSNMADLLATWESASLQNTFSAYFWGPLEYSSGSGEVILPTSTSTATVTTSRVTSMDTTRTAHHTTENNRWGHVVYVPQLSKYVAVAFQASTSNHVATSSDGITWTPKAGQAGPWNKVVYASALSMLAAVGGGGVMTSTDGGDTWTLQTLPTLASASWQNIAWSPTLGKFLIVGHNGDFTASGLGYAATSTDGSTWTDLNWDSIVPKITGRGSQAFTVDWSEDLGLWCVGGNVSSYASSNGTTWTRGDMTGSDMSTNYIKYVPDLKRFVCTQTVNTTATDKMRYSTDGVNWTIANITADRVNGWTYMPNRKTIVVKNNQGLTYHVAQPAVATGNVVVTSNYTSATKTNGFSYVPEVFIEAAETAYGAIAGGSTFKVFGGGFTGVTSVTIGGTAATSYTVDSRKQITVTAPAGTLGAKDVVVTTSFGSATLSNGFRYISVPTPVQYTLDNVTSTFVSYAISNRRVRSGYTGPIFRVRKSTTNKWTHVYDQLITDSGETLTTWLGGASAFVVTWYDQSTNANHAYRYENPSQPSLNASTAVVDFNASKTLTNTLQAIPTGTTSYTMVLRHGTTVATSAGDYMSIGAQSATPTYASILRRANATQYANLWFNGGATFTFNGYAHGNSVSVVYDQTNRKGYVNGVLKGTLASTGFVVGTGAAWNWVGGTGNYSNAEFYSLYATSDALSDADRLWLEADGVDLTIASTSVSNGTTNGGTTVVITGTGFYGVDTVSFGGVNAASFTIDSPTQITAVTASTTAVGAVGNVVVSSAIDSATSTNGWTYWPPMSFTSIDVATGVTTGGTTVVITGAGFYAVSSVTFGGTAVASYTVDSATQITVSTGVSSVTSPTLGDVVVTSPYTSTTGTNVWTYYPPIVVSSLDVSYGKVSGGTTVNITGSGFHNVNSVTFKGIEVLSKTVNSPTSITVTVKGDVTQLVGRNSYMGTGPPTSNFMSPGSWHCWAGGSIQKWIVPGAYVYTSNDAVTFTVANVPTPTGLRYAMYVPSLGKAYVVGGGNVANRFLESTDAITWTSPGVLPINRSWNWAAYSPTLDVFVVVNRSSTANPFAVSTDRGATWTEYGTGTNRAFATIVWCTAIGKFVAGGFNSTDPGIIAHSADGITWTEVNLATLFPSASDVGIRQTCSVSEDLGIVWFCSSTNSFTWNGTTWQTNTSSVINNPVWVSSVYAFVGLISNVAYAYSSDGLTWTNVSVNGSGANVYGSFAYSPEQDVFLATGTTSSWNFTNPNISVNNSVVVTSTYTSGTKANAWAFVPTMAISDVDIGYGPTAGSTTVKIYGRGFRNINPGSVTFNGVQATSFTVHSDGCLITAVTAAGTAGTGNIVCANSFRNATLTNGWSYKNVSVSSYDYDSLTAPAKSSLMVALRTRPVLSTYSGPLFRVLRSTDREITDVYASSGNSADWFTKNGVSLATWKGAATLRVIRWFDQSGSTLSSDAHIPKPPGSGTVFAFIYQPDKMPILDLTANCVDFNVATSYLGLADSVTPAVTSPYTITVRHGTVGNSTNGELWNIGTNTSTAPGSGNLVRRQGSNYINNWPGVNTLTLTGAYADNQVVTFTNNLTTRTGYVDGSSVNSIAGTLAGDVLSPTIGGRGSAATDSLAQIFIFAAASTVFGTSDLAVLEDSSLYTVPAISSVNIASGPTTGGTTVVITGTGFTGASAVSFGGTSATSFTVDSATQITAVTAAGSAGRGDIVVTKPTGTITFTNGWIYYETNYTRYFAVTDISTTTGLNKTVNSWLTTITFSSALGLFIVADGQSGITQPYVTSSDATTWTRQTAPAAGGNDSINDIAASSTAVVSCGILPLIRRSTNAVTWTNVTSTNTLTFRIAYSPTLSRWAIGRGNTNGLYYSNDDGVTWTAATGAAVYVANVLWNSGSSEFYVFIRNGGSVYRSSNGTSYTLAASSLANDNYHAAAYSSDRNEMMTVGNNSSNVYSSTDGTTWTLKSTITGTRVVGLTWNSELGVYVGCTNKGLYITIDGSVWTAMNPLTWSGTFDFSWGRWVYNPTVRKGVAAYVNTVFRTEDTVRASLSFAASQNVQITNDADLRPGTGDFTVEWFQYQTAPSAGTTPYVFSIANDLAVSVNGSTGLWSVFVGGSAVITHTPTNVYGRWCHFSLTRTGTTLGLFKDGARLTTVTNSTNIANSTDVLRIANSSTTSGTNQYLGRITNFHFVKGTAVYTGATYTVPTREIFAIANSKVLLPTPNGNLVGNYSGVAKTITNNSATSSSENPFYL